jgi:DNA-binding NarL/FixJ family response regulator
VDLAGRPAREIPAKGKVASMGISILIAGQQRMFADALAIRLQGEDDLEVVGAVQVESANLRLLALQFAEVLVLDGDLPGDAVNRMCKELSGRRRPTRVLMLSSSSEPERIVEAIAAGAAAWVRKDQSLEYLLSAIRAVARGETWLPPTETGNVVRLLLSEQARRRRKERLLARLTPQEQAVLACLAEGIAQREAVAERLHVSVHTVRTHMQNLMSKLGVHSALEAVALAKGGNEYQPPAEPPATG